MQNEPEMEILTRFIGSFFCIDRNGNPKINVFVKRDKEAGLSVWDISKYIKSNDETSIFKIGDKNFAKKPPYTIARCDLERNDVDKTFKTIESKFNNVNYKIKGNFFSLHKDICFNANNNPALVYHVAQELLNISSFKNRPKNI